MPQFGGGFDADEFGCGRNGGRGGPIAPRGDHSCRTWWTNATALAPSPIADATRFMLLDRTSPTAKTPGRLVSRTNGARVSGQCAATRSACDKSVPVFTNPLESRATQP